MPLSSQCAYVDCRPSLAEQMACLGRLAVFEENLYLNGSFFRISLPNFRASIKEASAPYVYN